MRIFEEVNPVKCFDVKPLKLGESVSRSREHCPVCDQLLGYVKKGSTAPAPDEDGLTNWATCTKGFYVCANKEAHDGKSAYFTGKKKSGRKKLPEDQVRSVSVACKLTEAEAEVVDQKRGQMGRGQWLREAAFKNAPKPIPEINREAWADLARLGGNLNQVAKHLNEGGKIEVGELRSLLDQLRLSLIKGLEGVK